MIEDVPELLESLSITAASSFLERSDKYPTLSDAVVDTIKTSGVALNPKQIRAVVQGANNYVYQSMFKQRYQPVSFKIAKANEVFKKLNISDKVEKTASDLSILDGAILDEQIGDLKLVDAYFEKLAEDDPYKKLDNVFQVPIYKIKEFIEKLSEDINEVHSDLRHNISLLREKLAEDLKNNILHRNSDYLRTINYIVKSIGKFGMDIIHTLDNKLEEFKYSSEDVRTLPKVKVDRFPENFQYELQRYKNLNEFLYKMSRLRSLTNTEMDYIKSVFKECPYLMLRIDKDTDRNAIIKVAQLGTAFRILSGGLKGLKWGIFGPGKAVRKISKVPIIGRPTSTILSQFTPPQVGLFSLFGTKALA